MYHFLASVVARLEPCFARRDWVLICSTGLASFLCKKADIDFEQYENRQTEDKADIDSHINLLFEKRFEPRIHPTEEVVKTQGLRDLFKDLVTNAEICEDGLSKILLRYGVNKFTPHSGDVFDPNKHKLAFFVPDPNREPGLVAVVKRDGYIYGDEVIRQAEVGVTRGVATRRSRRPSPIPSQ
ncbi:grpE protein homolog 2, mitochondrial-like [Coffea eugenioides]|uniref:grpE protein homolog 2, mitochondrial-like n=1 Tax=Coffea eugenioides TaxID=49369 RepID=UPI000F607948|nr:grpE protein homolog 2, mitochondrial-like [Coffea eugenioides]XP_027164159.1 grpE protein homolog 2, mitochondrial-like [Coffea eugenioides]XP_027164167.1 grpE protein homolog 2, mitochondrial-like [Coffea eugenioides]